MSSKSKIEWTDATWNPVTGCTPISPGCANCYAQRYLHRFKRPTHVVCHPSRLDEPVHWKKPRRIFVCSMADLFHKDVPDSFILEVYSVMVGPGSRHTYQVLTKRADRLGRLAGFLPVAGNIWHGVTVENEDAAIRIGHLQGVPSRVRFLSMEPLLEGIDLTAGDLAGIHWVIVGGESGPGARSMETDWVRRVRDACLRARVAFFFKQGYNNGCMEKTPCLDGKRWKETP